MPRFVDAKTVPIPREGDTEIDLAPAGAETVIELALDDLEESDPEPSSEKWRASKTEIDTTPSAALSGAMVISGEISEPDPEAETNPTIRIRDD